MKAAPAATEEKTRFAAVLAHELRTPLAGILGFSEMLRDDAASGQAVAATVVAEHAEGIHRSGERLLELTQRCELWLDITTRLSAVTGPDRDTWCDDQWTGTMEREVRHIALRAERVDDVTFACAPAALALPKDLLTPVLRQLVDNALKFSRPGDAVTVDGAVLGALHYALTITDAGRGFPMAQIGSIAAFVQFERERHEQQGLGLGLAIARDFAELVGGSLILEPAPTGRGTSVRLLLPRARRADVAQEATPEASTLAMSLSPTRHAR